MNGAAVYLHPENAGVAFNSDLLVLTCWNDGISVVVPIGPLGLIQLGNELVQVGKELEGRFND